MLNISTREIKTLNLSELIRNVAGSCQCRTAHTPTNPKILDEESDTNTSPFCFVSSCYNATPVDRFNYWPQRERESFKWEYCGSNVTIYDLLIPYILIKSLLNEEDTCALDEKELCVDATHSQPTISASPLLIQQRKERRFRTPRQITAGLMLWLDSDAAVDSTDE